MLRLDIEVSWDILHLVEDSWKKRFSIYLDLREKYHSTVEYNYFKKIIGRLAKSGLIESRRGAGIRKSQKNIITLREVMKANGAKLNLAKSTGPGAMISRRLSEFISRKEFINNKSLSQRIK